MPDAPDLNIVRIPNITELTLLIKEISERYKDDATARFAIGDFVDALEERYAYEA